MKEYGDKIPVDKKGVIETAAADLKEAHKNQDFDAIDKASATLNEAWQAASQDMYAQSQDGAPGADPGAGTDPNAGGDAGAGAADDVTDVEFEEIEEK